MKAGAFSFCILNCVGLLAVPAISQMERPDGRQSRDYANVVSRPDSTQLDSFILAVMNDYRIPGVAACIVRGKEIIWNGAYGYADIAEKRKVNDSTAFVIASLSKTVTGTALMQLAEKGLLNLDDDINGHLPSDIKIVNPDYPNEKITFRMLLTHTSSIDFDWTLFTSLMSWGMDSPLSTEHFVRNYFLPGGSHHSYGPFNTWAPGSKWEYSNEAMTLVGFLVDVLCDTTFEAYIDRNILNPLKISGAGWHLADMDTLNLAVPYTYDNGLKPLRHYGSPMYTCGLLKASARGLGRFLLNIRLRDFFSVRNGCIQLGKECYDMIE